LKELNKKYRQKIQDFEVQSIITSYVTDGRSCLMHKLSAARKRVGLKYETWNRQDDKQRTAKVSVLGDGLGGHFAGSQYFLSIPSLRTAHSI
jgi:hypothetical protein